MIDQSQRHAEYVIEQVLSPCTKSVTTSQKSHLHRFNTVSKGGSHHQVKYSGKYYSCDTVIALYFPNYYFMFI